MSMRNCANVQIHFFNPTVANQREAVDEGLAISERMLQAPFDRPVERHRGNDR